MNRLPHLTGDKKDAPHETLYWRWMDQVTIHEFPCKLILLGSKQSMLFDISKPGGGDHTRELRALHPEITARLRAKPNTWMATFNREEVTFRLASCPARSNDRHPRSVIPT